MTGRVLRPGDGDKGMLTAIGVRFMVNGRAVGGGFDLVEHPLPPRSLAAPLHRHHREDEYSFVLEGRIGALLGDQVVYAGPGDLVRKPRGEWHTFWNAGDTAARILEVISPAGFEGYFREMVNLPKDAALSDRAAIARRYELDVDPTSVPALLREHGLRFGALSSTAESPTAEGRLRGSR